MEELSAIPITITDNSFEIAMWVWQNLVPKSSQLETVKGELLRCLEKLAWETQNNGNLNWEPQSAFLAVIGDKVAKLFSVKWPKSGGSLP